MYSLLEGFSARVGHHLIVEDDRPASIWAGDLSIPNSARSSKFDISTTPHLREPIDCLPDNRIKEAVILMPIGSGKTTIFDVHVPRAIKEDPGSILLTMQTDEDAKGYWDERLEPIILSVPSLSAMADAMPRNKRRRGEWVLPHLTLYVQGSKPSAYQRKSVRWVFLDEAWMIKHGLIQEARGRTHRRWNARVVLVSQGGWTHVLVNGVLVHSELDSAWLRTDRREYHMVCPECSHAQIWKMSSLKWVTQRGDDGKLDERALMESAGYKCQGRCGTQFADNIDIRRALSNESIYKAMNPAALDGYVGWHCNILALYWQAWGETALKFHLANESKKLGDPEPLRLFIQKDLAENYKADSDAPEVVLKASDEYSVRDFLGGELWDGETFRFMTIDRQRDHFWSVVRAWKNDGSSRLLWAGRIDTVELCREKQLQYKVRDKFTFEDAQYDPGSVYDDCVKYGWVALHGSKQKYFMHPGKNPEDPQIKKLYSAIKMADAPTQKGKAKYIVLATDPLKDLLASMIAGRHAPFEHPSDISAEYEPQMRSETKRPFIDRVTKETILRWSKLHSRSQNHLWDVEYHQVGAGLMAGILRPGDSTIDDAPIDTPPEASTER